MQIIKGGVVTQQAICIQILALCDIGEIIPDPLDLLILLCLHCPILIRPLDRL